MLSSSPAFTRCGQPSVVIQLWVQPSSARSSCFSGSQSRFQRSTLVHSSSRTENRPEGHPLVASRGLEVRVFGRSTGNSRARARYGISKLTILLGKKRFTRMIEPMLEFPQM